MSEGHIERGGHRTWYRIVGELAPGAPRAPVVVCHGGPGATHDYVLAIAGLAREGRACVLYDQLGNGRSDHLTDADASFWAPELFADELDDLIAHLGIGERYHVVGHSWGGMLGYVHALRRPPGLLSLVAADSPASAEAFAAGARALLGDLPDEVRATIERHEAAGTTDSPDYQQAILVFYRRHVCRLDPWPPEVEATFAALESDPTVYATLNGPSEFTVVGSLRDFDVTDRLGEIEVPVLLVSGAHDEVRPEVVRAVHERLPRSRWELFEDSSHMPHVEERERFLTLVEGFLREVEEGGGADRPRP
jgi:L-proline amide hydrolase